MIYFILLIIYPYDAAYLCGIIRNVDKLIIDINEIINQSIILIKLHVILFPIKLHIRKNIFKIFYNGPNYFVIFTENVEIIIL